MQYEWCMIEFPYLVAITYSNVNDLEVLQVNRSPGFFNVKAILPRWIPMELFLSPISLSKRLCFPKVCILDFMNSKTSGNMARQIFVPVITLGACTAVWILYMMLMWSCRTMPYILLDSNSKLYNFGLVNAFCWLKMVTWTLDKFFLVQEQILFFH